MINKLRVSTKIALPIFIILLIGSIVTNYVTASQMHALSKNSAHNTHCWQIFFLKKATASRKMKIAIAFRLNRIYNWPTFIFISTTIHGFGLHTENNTTSNVIATGVKI